MMNTTITSAPTATPYRPSRPVRRIEPTQPFQSTGTPTIRTIAATPVTSKKRVAGYARVSTELESQEGSYELQCQHYTDYINEHEDWTLVKVYADEGKTGTSTRRRTEFRQMIADAEEGKIDLIITKSISRFARNTVDCLETVRKLKSLPKPVGVYFEKENIDSLDGKSELILTILSSLAQDESRSISENIKWSFQKLYEQGYVNCPTCRLLGYDTVINHTTGEKKIVIEPVGASVVKMIYDEFLSGKGYSEIAHHMEKLGAITGSGAKRWSAMTIVRILENEKYTGDVITQKGFTRDFLTHERLKNDGQLPKYIAEGHHEAIIDRDTWLAVQEKLHDKSTPAVGKKAPIDPNTVKRTHHSDRTVFSSNLFCGACGETLFRRTTALNKRNEGKTRHFIWKCRNSEGRGHEDCNAKSIPELVLQQTFMEMLAGMSARPREELITEFKLANGVTTTEPKNAEELRLELDSITAQVESMAADPELYADMLEDLQNRKQEIEATLSAPDWAVVSPLKKAAFDWFLEQLDGISPYDSSKTTIPFRADIFERCVEHGKVNEIRQDGLLVDIAIRYTFIFGLEATAYGNRRPLRTALDIEKTIETEGEMVAAEVEAEAEAGAEEQNELDKAV
ncbi:MAG: recombinase family protein [Bacilli bacterium]|nr:recombinase family protein [Bacilli bacterium]